MGGDLCAHRAGTKNRGFFNPLHACCDSSFRRRMLFGVRIILNEPSFSKDKSSPNRPWLSVVVTVEQQPRRRRTRISVRVKRLTKNGLVEISYHHGSIKNQEVH